MKPVFPKECKSYIKGGYCYHEKGDRSRCYGRIRCHVKEGSDTKCINFILKHKKESIKK